MTKCKFIVKSSSFQILVVFLPIFVADTKITFVYNFVAPLIIMSSSNFRGDIVFCVITGFY